MQNFTETDLRKSTYKLKTYIRLMEEDEQSATAKALADRPSEVQRDIEEKQAEIDKLKADLEELRNRPPEPEDDSPRSWWQKAGDIAKGAYTDLFVDTAKDIEDDIKEAEKEKAELQKQLAKMTGTQAPAGQTQPPAQAPTAPASQTQPPAQAPTAPAGQTQPPAQAPTAPAGQTQPSAAPAGQTQPSAQAPSTTDAYTQAANWSPDTEAELAAAVASANQTPSTASTSATRQTGAAKPKSTKPAKQSAKSDPFIMATQQDLNKRLAQIGKPPIKVDGINGPKTREALRTVMDYEHVNRRQRATQPASTPAAQPAPNATSNPFVFSESTKYNEDPILTRIIQLAGL